MAEIPLLNRRREVVAVTSLDEADLELVLGYVWHLAEGYATTNVLHPQGGLRSDGIRARRCTERMHRMILGLVPGDGILVDHRNLDKLDNHRSNLRKATDALNAQNRPLVPSATSRFRGVVWDQERGKWRAQAMLNRKGFNLGRFDSEEEAAEVSASWRREHMPFSEEALINHD